MKKFFNYLIAASVVMILWGIGLISWFHFDIKSGEDEYLKNIEVKADKACDNLSSAVIADIEKLDPDEIKKILNKKLVEYKLVTHGFSFVLDDEGKFISGRDDSAVGDNKDIYTYAEEEDIASFSLFGKSAKARIPNKFNMIASKSGELLWGIIRPIKGTDCSLGVVAVKDAAVIASTFQLSILFYGTILLALGFSVLMFSLGFKMGKTRIQKLWISTSLFGAAILLGSLAICMFSFKYISLRVHTDETALTEVSVLDNYMNKLDLVSIQKGFGPCIKIPTGIFINTIDMESAVNVRFTGTIWQKVSKDFPDEKMGIFFPDAVESEIEEYYRYIKDDVKSVGWKFNILMRENFNGIKYPFDTEQFWIRMLPPSFFNNVILVPSFDDYKTVNTKTLPGLLDSIVLPGWKPVASYFSYMKKAYNTNFGIPDFIGQNGFPELFFNITVQRRFLDPFISDILPLAVVVVLVFIMLLTCSLDEGKFEVLGFSAGAVFSYIAALFFVVIVEHIEFRGNMASENITYMDLFYFLVYGQFLLVSAYTLLLCWHEKFRFVTSSSNEVVKSLFWPSVSFAVFAATVFFFHP